METAFVSSGTDGADDKAHVAQILLDQLIDQPDWVLPYLPKACRVQEGWLGSSWAMKKKRVI